MYNFFGRLGYNVFRWPDKLDIYKLNKLYKLDAQGIHDEVLADEIGLILYLRCKYGKSDMQLMEKIKSDAMDAIMSLMEK